MATATKKKAAKKKTPTNRIAGKLAESNGKATKKSTAKTKNVTLVVSPPNFQVAQYSIRGISPYVQNKFSQKAKEMMMATQAAGSTGGKGKKREAKDFQKCYEGALHQASQGWYGIPAPAFRNALISACKIVGFQMTRAKLSLFCLADGHDKEDGSPLVKITKGKPRKVEHPVRNESGVCDIRSRPMWDPGWEAKVRIQFDADQFTLADVTNLMHRISVQVGIGEGRPDSKKSNGQGWGLFELLSK